MKVNHKICSHCAWIERGLLDRCIYTDKLLIELYWTRRERACNVYAPILYPTIP